MKKNHILWASLSFLCLFIGFHSTHFWWLSWLSFVPLFLLSLDTTLPVKPLASLTYLVGFLYYARGLIGLLAYGINGFCIYMIVLAAAVTIFPVYFISFRFLTHNTRSITLQILAATALWLTLWKLLSLTILGSTVLEQLFDGPLAFFQITPLAGFQLHAGLVVGLCIALATLLKKFNRSSLIASILCLSCLGLCFLWGHFQLSQPVSAKKTATKVAIIQHNLEIGEMWHMKNQGLILETYQKMAREAASHGAQFIIFPSYDVYPDELNSPQFFTNLSQETRAFILVGTYVDPNTQTASNGTRDIAILYSPDNRIYGTYEAYQPPPFRDFFPKHAPEYKLLDTPFGKAGVLLCYENSLPKIARKAARLGAEVLISLSNPGFFTHSLIPYYHLMQDRLRALETGKFVLRASPNGYSAVIDPRGRILQSLDLGKTGILYADLPLREETPFFQKYPDGLSALALAFLIALFLKTRKRR